MEVTIAHIYPEILNHYGDKGNIITLKRRLEKRSIEVNITEYHLGSDIEPSCADIIYIGGGTERSQLIAANELMRIKDELKTHAENNGVILAVCSGYEIIGKTFEADGKSQTGLGILNINSTSTKERLIGNIVTENSTLGFDIVGFENHSGRMEIGSLTPLGKVKSGYGNTDLRDYEGVIYKNVIGTYIHGPLLPKNPRLADYIIECALKNKYGECVLSPLDDKEEILAHNYMAEKLVQN